MAALKKPGAGLFQEYHGNCHCGSFRFSLHIPPLKHIRACNCSICTRNGYMWIRPEPEDAVTITQGKDILRGYEFGARTRTHMFCPCCGTSVFARHHASPLGTGTSLEINARTLSSLDLSALTPIPFNGATLPPPYSTANPQSEAQSKPTKSPDDEGNVTYDGSCHCGAVSYSVTTKPLEEAKVMCCNCSLCSRNGDLWIYPRKALVRLQGHENLVAYPFLHADSLHAFCSTCGVSVVVLVSAEDTDVCPVNVRTICGVEIDELKLEKFDGWGTEPVYVLPETGRREI